MNFKVALYRAIRICGESVSDPFSLHCALCDLIGNDHAALQQAEEIFALNQRLYLLDTLKRNTNAESVSALLKYCEAEDDLPRRRYLSYIRYLFEYYYQEQCGSKEDAKNILYAISTDFYREDPTGAVTPWEVAHAEKERERLLEKKAPSSPDKMPSAPLAPQKKSPVPITVRASAASTSAVSAPHIPNARYRLLPEDTCVYKAIGSPVLHISNQCPCLRPSLGLTIQKGVYSRARYVDYYRVHHVYDREGAETHVPPVCKTCGSFTPMPLAVYQKTKYRAI